MPDDDNLSELLDDDKLPTEYPPEEPLGVDEEELTVRGQQTDEPLAERVRREVPEMVPGAEDDPVGPLVAPGGDEGLDLTRESVASEVASGDGTTGDVATERVESRTAEEEAIHVTEAPPTGDGDGSL